MTSVADPPVVDAAVSAALDRAVGRLLSLQNERGWWKGELETNVSMDAEDLLLRQFLGIRTDEQTRLSAQWIRSQQRDDGTWEIVDYKTGATEPEPLQLAIYARAVDEIWGKQSKASWLSLRDGSERAGPDLVDLDATLEDGARRLAANGDGAG